MSDFSPEKLHHKFSFVLTKNENLASELDVRTSNELNRHDIVCQESQHDFELHLKGQHSAITCIIEDGWMEQSWESLAISQSKILEEVIRDKKIKEEYIESGGGYFIDPSMNHKIDKDEAS